MGLGNLPDNTTVAAGLTIKSADFLTAMAALEGALVGRNTSGVATSGQSLGTLIYPWGPIYGSSLNINGSAIDLSGITSEANRIISGKTRTTSGQPQFLQADGAAAAFDLLGLTTPLVLNINSVAATVSTDITKGSLTLAPASNNTCLINDTTFADQADSKYYGEIDAPITKIIIDTVGSEISARVGQFIALKGATEIMFGFLKSATELTNVRRGYFFDDVLAPIVRETLANNDTLTLHELGWIFIEDDGLTVDVSYKTPVDAYTAPGSPAAGQYWKDRANDTWKRYSGSDWVAVNRIPVGLAVMNTSYCIATRSFDFFGDFSDENTIEAVVYSDEIVRSVMSNNRVNVYGTHINVNNWKIDWNNTTDMETGAVGNDTEYYLYISTVGQAKISTERPYDRRGDLRGFYHPYNNWRFICKAKTDGSADWINVISSGATTGYSRGLNFDAVGLEINYTGVDTVTVKYQSLTLRNASGKEKTVYNRTHTLTFSSLLQGSELASTWYPLWVDWDLNFKFVPDLTGTTTGTTAGYLVDSGNLFATYSVFRDAIVYNTTDRNETFVTVSATADNANLALNADNFTSGETYKIHSLDPVGLGEGRAHIGYAFNNASSNIDDVGYSRPELQAKKEYSKATGDWDGTAANWTTNVLTGSPFQTLDFSNTPVWKLEFNLNGSFSAGSGDTHQVQLSGIESIATYNQAVSVYFSGVQAGAADQYFYSYVQAAGGYITTLISSSIGWTGTWGFGETVKLVRKPTWATRS